MAALADEATGLAWATGLSDTGASSLTDGHLNTQTLATPVGNFPAAQACLNRSGQGFTDWYLPAICELGRYIGFGSDAGCGSTNPNLYSALHTNGIGGFADPFYWSSTEFSGDPQSAAWAQSFSDGAQLTSNKTSLHSVRCVRSFSP